MNRADAIRLRHMLDAAVEALGFAAGHSRVDLNADRLLVLALVKAVEIVGEAAYQLSPDARESLPQVPWDDIIGMRHRLVHAYFDINLDVVWRTIGEDLPALVSVLRPAMPPEAPR